MTGETTEGPRKRSPAAAIALVAFMALALFGAAFAALTIWNNIGDVAIGLHGRLAMALGAALTLFLGAGLMFLVFFSSRRGYDDLSRDASPNSSAGAAPRESDSRRSTKPSGSSSERWRRLGPK